MVILTSFRTGIANVFILTTHLTVFRHIRMSDLDRISLYLVNHHYPYKNNYTLHLIDLCIKSFFNNLYTSKAMVPNVPKRNVFVKLPLLGSTSF